jgi:hypothetical protein
VIPTWGSASLIDQRAVEETFCILQTSPCPDAKESKCDVLEGARLLLLDGAQYIVINDRAPTLVTAMRGLAKRPRFSMTTVRAPIWNVWQSLRVDAISHYARQGQLAE